MFVVFLIYDNDKERQMVSCMCKILRQIGGLTATQLLQKYEISIEPPIDLTKLLNRIGIRAYAFDFHQIEDRVGYERGEILGAAISEGDALDIMYSEDFNQNRIRFTIAHELAHCCLHAENLEMNHLELRTDSNISGREKSANIFAGELLIPQESVLEIIGQLYEPTVETLARIFQVSKTVMDARLKYLDIELPDTSYKGA